MKLIATLLLAALTNFALVNDEGTFAQVPSKKVFTNQTKITWEEFKSGIPEICKGIKSGGHYIQKDACVFWSQEKNGDWTCLIFTQEGIGDAVFAKLVKRCFLRI